jgi:hypothetical protein
MGIEKDVSNKWFVLIAVSCILGVDTASTLQQLLRYKIFSSNHARREQIDQLEILSREYLRARFKCPYEGSAFLRVAG